MEKLSIFINYFIKKVRNYSLLIIHCLLFIVINSCVTHYQRSIQFHRNFESGNLAQAESDLKKDTKAAHSKTKLLHYLNLGTITSLTGKYEESNQYFEEAHRLGDSYHKNYLNEILAYFTNPMIVDYKGEDFELLMINYYKALNYLKMGNKSAALVECKRMNIKLLALSGKYDSEQKYQRDAFMHTLMGIIYEANGEVNDAFIAYRNAIEIYENDYKKFFNLDVPEQLKKDVLRTAYQLGFQDELRRFEEKFQMKHQPQSGTGDLVFFWNNGLAPIKSEWSANLNLSQRGGNVYFTNEDLGLNFPFPWQIQTNQQGQRIDILNNLNIVRVAFPKYIPRNPYYEGAELHWLNETQRLELAEDINAIAVKTLRQRMVLEMGKALLRLAIKQAEVAALKKDQKRELAFVINLFNTFSEQADTRAWHTLPHSIYYTRMSLPAGTHKVQMNAYHQGKSKTWDFTFDIKRGATTFHSFNSLETDNKNPTYTSGWNR